MPMRDARLDLHISVEGMRARMVEFLQAESGVVEKILDDKLKNMLDTGELQRALEAEVARAVHEELKSVVRRSVGSIFRDPSAVAAFTKMALDAQEKFFKEYGA